MSYPYPTIRKGPYSVYSPPTLYGPSGYGAYGAASSQPCIRKGAKGEAVRALQAALGEEGYNKDGSRTSQTWEEDEESSFPVQKAGNLCDPRCDGDFGRQTEKALKAFQRDNGLTPDGIAGPQTWNKLGSSGLPCGGSGGSGGGRGSGGSSSSPKTYVSPSGEVLPTGFKAPFYEEKWFYWTAGLGGAAILAALVFWPKGKK